MAPGLHKQIPFDSQCPFCGVLDTRQTCTRKKNMLCCSPFPYYKPFISFLLQPWQTLSHYAPSLDNVSTSHSGKYVHTVQYQITSS